jgi:hypothetical protein
MAARMVAKLKWPLPPDVASRSTWWLQSTAEGMESTSPGDRGVAGASIDPAFSMLPRLLLRVPPPPPAAAEPLMPANGGVMCVM